MSEKKDEMVAIEIPLSDARLYAAYLNKSPLAEACRSALEARKSKYERWRDELAIDGPPHFWTERAVRERTALGYKTSRLMAAAPQLMDALIGRLSYTRRTIPRDDQFLEEMEAAIRAALPEDVAEEVLGE